MNNKGFMMAEVVVVASIVLLFLAGLYVSYNKLFALYSTRINYYDSATLYNLAYYRDKLIRDKKMNTVLQNLNTGNYVDIFNNGSNSVLRNDVNDRVYLVHNSMQRVDRSTLSSVININPTYLDYVDYLSTSLKFKSNYIMLMESCIIPEGKVDEFGYSTEKTCKYAYLEVYDGKEDA